MNERTTFFTPLHQRRGLAVALAALLCILASACGGGDTETTTDSTDAEASATSAPEGGATDDTATDDTATDDTEGGDDGAVWDAEFIGAVPETVEDGARIITNYGEFEDAGSGLTGKITFAAEGQIGLGGEAEIGSIACLQIEIELPDGAVEVPDGADEVEITLPAKVAFQYRACPPSVMADPVDYDMTFTFADDTSFTASFLFNETLVEFQGTPA